MSKKNKGGRPTVMTKETINKLEHAFAIDATVLEACSYANISPETFYNYLEKTPKFSDRIAELRERPVLAARTRAVRGVKESYSNAVDYLSRKKKAEFSQKQELELSGQVNVSKLLDEAEKK